MIIYIHLSSGDKKTILKVIVQKTRQKTTPRQDLSMSVIPRTMPRFPQTSEVTWISINQLIGETRITWLIRLLYIKIQEFHCFVSLLKEAAKNNYDVCTREKSESDGEREMPITLKGQLQYPFSEMDMKMKQSLEYLTRLRGNFDPQGSIDFWVALYGAGESAKSCQGRNEMVTDGQEQELDSASPAVIQEQGHDVAVVSSEACKSAVKNDQERQNALLYRTLPGTVQEDGHDVAVAGSEECNSVKDDQEQQKTLLYNTLPGTVQEQGHVVAVAGSETCHSAVKNDQERQIPPHAPFSGALNQHHKRVLDAKESNDIESPNTAQIPSPNAEPSNRNKLRYELFYATKNNPSTQTTKDAHPVANPTSTGTTQGHNTRSISDQKSSIRERLRQGFQRMFGSKKNKVVPVTSAEDCDYIPMNLTDIDARVFAEEITTLEKEMFGRIRLEEVLDKRWKSKERWTSSPNVSAMAEFYSRMVIIVTTEILAQERPRQRARVMAKVIKMADRCAEIHNYNATKALVTSLRSPPVYRLRDTWKELKNKRKSTLHHLYILTSSADDYAFYYRHRLACKKNTNSLHFLGDALGQMNYIQSVYNYSKNEDASSHTCADVSAELQDLLCSYQVAADGFEYPRHPGVARLLMTTAEVKTLVENYDLSLVREP